MEKYESWQAKRFQGLTRNELREAGKMFGCNFGPNAGDATMREQLCAKAGLPLPGVGTTAAMLSSAGSGGAADDPFAPVPPQNVTPIRRKKLKRLNLDVGAPASRWEGKRYRVMVNRTQASMNHKSFVLKPNGHAKAFPYEEVIDLPAPYYWTLKNALTYLNKEIEIRDEKNIAIRVDREFIPQPVYPMQEFGVTPGTENLPQDYAEYWTQQANETRFFADYERKDLIFIYADLYGQQGAQFYRDMTVEDIRFSILSILGLDDVEEAVA